MRILFIFLFVCTELFSQHLTPLEASNFQKLTSSVDLLDYVEKISRKSNLIKLDTLAITAQRRIIPYLKISKGEFGWNKDRLKVMILAQQHGNEHSGKEALLFFLKQIANGKHSKLLDKIELLIIPQMNPDGNDVDKRRNGNDVDLNRNHLILTEPETIGLHKLFNKYLPEVTIDIHEYYPYSKEWIDSGYRKKYDVQIGVLTNLNVDGNIRETQKNEFLPFIFKYLYDNGFTSTEYIVGGPPTKERLRYSTVDINDGRQSFGILNTFSLIFEGINGKTPIENIEHRTKGQLEAVIGTLEYLNTNTIKIKKLIRNTRKSISELRTKSVVLQMEHVADGGKEISLHSIKTNKDTLIKVLNFHTKVENILESKMPYGFLIPKDDVELFGLIQKHGIVYKNYEPVQNEVLYQYQIINNEKKQIEDREVIIPKVIKKIVMLAKKDNYLFIPLSQLHSNLLMLMFEPESMISILQYEQYSFLLNENSIYPILRVERK